VTIAAITVGGDPTDNQACVRTPVEPASIVGPEAGASTSTVAPPADSAPETAPATGILPRTGAGSALLAFGAVFLLAGFGLTAFARRRRARRSA
jgi:LPXTG-motif cell wall-anchored protein